ncbi:hypothetical protein [Nostoc sp.]
MLYSATQRRLKVLQSVAELRRICPWRVEGFGGTEAPVLNY